jgi:nicotinamidase/pyrazinamidase
MKRTLCLSLLTLLNIHSVSAHFDAVKIAAKLAALNLDPKTTGVLLVDIQRDFTEGGSLAVPNAGTEYVDAAADVTQKLRAMGYKIYASQDFHPANHTSFASNNPGKNVFESREDGQVMWPAHCVQGTPGADILIPSNDIDDVTPKGTNPDFDSYSALEDKGGKKTGLYEKLKNNNIKTLVAFGLATDYCVRDSVVDAQKYEFKVYVAADLCLGIDPEGSKKALRAMQDAGATIINADN